jgi:organic hydroperoxide reductase OsmC/OhrA
MAEYTAKVEWKRSAGEVFTDNKYSRAHAWRFDGGAEVRASSAPNVVKPPYSDPAGVDPEEALVASLSSCHMLWFLGLAAKQGFVVDAYLDDALGVMAKNSDGRIAMTQVTLRPAIQFSGQRQPTSDQLNALHHEAHDKCYIANSVKAEVRVLPT